MTQTGTVVWFNEKFGYGFIARESGVDVFVHHSACSGDLAPTLKQGDRVEFSVLPGKKGPAAVDVRILQKRACEDRPQWTIAHGRGAQQGDES